MSSQRVIGNAEYLKERIPQNPRYQHVRTRLDTGCSLSKYMEKLEDMKRNYRYRNDEIFKRLKVTTFAQLVLQVAAISDLNLGVNGEESPRPDGNCQSVFETELGPLAEISDGAPQATPTALHLLGHGEEGGADTHCTARSTLQSVIGGVGELDLQRNGRKAAVSATPEPSPRWTEVPYPDCPYLLLDVRDRDQYDQCHIVSAYSHPITLLSRTMNPYTKEALEYKNADGKIIIVYDEDERVASKAATAMCQRGFENLFMLSGGLKVLGQKFGEGMLIGPLPAACHPPSATPGGRKKRCGTLLSQLPSPTTTVTMTTPTLTTTERRKCRFTSEDLDKIQQQLEENLLPSCASSRLSSRMSSSSGQSKVSSARSRLGSSMSGKDTDRDTSSRPWKWHSFLSLCLGLCLSLFFSPLSPLLRIYNL